jgi:hypothetical protein
MTPAEFGQKLAKYFGEWKEEEHKRAVWGFVKTKSDQYLDAMYQLLMESRPPNFGAPSLFDIKEYHEEACNRMDFRKGLPASVREIQKAITGTVETPRETGFDADPNIKKLREKWETDQKRRDEEPLVYHRKEPAFPWLDGIRGDEPITLSSEYYEELSQEERMRRYCAKKAAIQGVKA